VRLGCDARGGAISSGSLAWPAGLINIDDKDKSCSGRTNNIEIADDRDDKGLHLITWEALLAQCHDIYCRLAHLYDLDLVVRDARRIQGDSSRRRKTRPSRMTA